MDEMGLKMKELVQKEGLEIIRDEKRLKWLNIIIRGIIGALAGCCIGFVCTAYFGFAGDDAMYIGLASGAGVGFCAVLGLRGLGKILGKESAKAGIIISCAIVLAIEFIYWQYYYYAYYM